MLLGVTQVLVSQVSVPHATLAWRLLFLVVLAVRPPRQVAAAGRLPGPVWQWW
jgi:hypothetical protein